ncbi:MAG: HAD-IA family hydrolase [Propionibacteriales bacterium]|nr:HAD-IA family hydrolase [Propionibacteriales bacterium]
MSSAHALDAVVLDIGGVLMDWDPRHLFGKVIEDAAEREWFLTEVCGPAWNRKQDEGRRWADAVTEATARHPDRAAWIRAYDERWLETVAGLYDDTVAVLQQLRSTGLPVYALTNFSAEKWDVATEAFAALGEFDGTVVSGVEGVVKPDPCIYAILLDRFDLTPQRTFFTDDVTANVEAARGAGLDAEVFTSAEVLRGQLTDRGVLRP